VLIFLPEKNIDFSIRTPKWFSFYFISLEVAFNSATTEQFLSFFLDLTGWYVSLKVGKWAIEDQSNVSLKLGFERFLVRVLIEPGIYELSDLIGLWEFLDGLYIVRVLSVSDLADNFTLLFIVGGDFVLIVGAILRGKILWCFYPSLRTSRMQAPLTHLFFRLCLESRLAGSLRSFSFNLF
jgi:hypothetical protein